MRLLILILPILVAACTSTNTIPEIVDYGCDDTVLRGRVVSVILKRDIPREQRCIFTTDGECIPWFGRYDLKIRVKKLFVGNESEAIIDAFYIAHSQIREDKDFIFVLRPKNSEYEMKFLFMIEGGSNYEIADQCSDVL